MSGWADGICSIGGFVSVVFGIFFSLLQLVDVELVTLFSGREERRFIAPEPTSLRIWRETQRGLLRIENQNVFP